MQGPYSVRMRNMCKYCVQMKEYQLLKLILSEINLRFEVIALIF